MAGCEFWREKKWPGIIPKDNFWKCLKRITYSWTSISKFPKIIFHSDNLQILQKTSRAINRRWWEDAIQEMGGRKLVGETVSLQDKCAMLSNGGHELARWINNNMQPIWWSIIISLTQTWEEVAPFQGSILGILSVCSGLDGIDILCASFQPVIHPSEENSGGVIILLCKERMVLNGGMNCRVKYWAKKRKFFVFCSFLFCDYTFWIQCLIRACCGWKYSP